MTVTIKCVDFGEVCWEMRIDMLIIPKVGDLIVRHNKRYKVKTREFDIDKDNITLYVD